MNIFKRGIETLRQPDRLPRCHEMTDLERQERIRKWNARNTWNTPGLAELDHPDQEEYWGA